MDRNEKQRPEPLEPPPQGEEPEKAPEQTTGGTGMTPDKGVPNPGFTARGD